MKSTYTFNIVPSDTTPADVGRGLTLLTAYQLLLEGQSLSWVSRYRDLHHLGSGGQGIVFLGHREGADGFTLPVALKVFSPESYRDPEAYDQDMARVAAVASRVALIQHDNLLDVHDFVAHEGVRVMVMEWVDGFDLRQLLTDATLEKSRTSLEPAHWRYVNDVIFTAGRTQPRFKPGVAIQILRDCLAGLAAIHREGIVHGDLKPANVMLKRTGTAKIIDIGSALDLANAAGRRMWSPAYAAPEVLDGGPVTPSADLASLGYVLVEMLAGRPPFEEAKTIAELRDAKHGLEQRLTELLPDDVSGNELLVYLCRRLIATDPARRFADAQSADLGRKGAAAFHRQLIKGNLASEYDNDLRVWLEQLK
ncbi:serine/threonine-protein kinase [Fimbriiglobus ruber]|uniref:Serine/threonine protein kinase n=1 Tax=Fimbriiglobus ruber TaxID=1908690 RepID=A0A225DST7_9BACT|nr:serine/threonine-protein kinase [Fimbriiglobus ruber]OWK44381.1 serine/threonine protein kinase [Fimbriiglobus ruber]